MCTDAAASAVVALGLRVAEVVASQREPAGAHALRARAHPAQATGKSTRTAIARFVVQVDAHCRLARDAVCRGRTQIGVSGGTVDEVSGCEGLSVDLSALWAEVDRLES